MKRVIMNKLAVFVLAVLRRVPRYRRRQRVMPVRYLAEHLWRYNNARIYGNDITATKQEL